ncbi:odorant receptor 85c-like [Chironomus tepperi]|uniref:odorant receptor 85c-like n=1 Tax=Chironomus tepperi TaxID=113505 RepID=UPI00391F76B2
MNCSFNFIFYTLITVASIDFQILSVNIRNIKNDIKDVNKMRTEMKEFIKIHNELFIIRNKLEEILSFPFLCTFISDSLNACFTAFYATISIGSTDMIEEAFFSFSSFLLVFSQCLFGQMLKDASESVADAIYECGWEDINDIQIRKAFISIIQRSQKSECLTVMKFGEVTLKQFSTASDE